MSDLPFVIDVTAESFSQTVLEQSQQIPVLVDFWAPWCGPCKSLMPMLVKLAEEYQGQFILAKVNVDEEQELAAQFGVRSVPTVKLIKSGQAVDEFSGTLPESEIRELLARHIERESDRQLAQAQSLLQNGNLDAAETLLTSLLSSEPDNANIMLLQAELLSQRGAYAEAKKLIDNLPSSVQSDNAVLSLLSRIEFAEVAEQAPDIDKLHHILTKDPDDSEARYQLSTLYLAAGDYEKAMEALLALMKRDRAYKDDAARKGLIKIFELLGNDHKLVSQYRRKMASILL